MWHTWPRTHRSLSGHACLPGKEPSRQAGGIGAAGWWWKVGRREVGVAGVVCIGSGRIGRYTTVMQPAQCLAWGLGSELSLGWGSLAQQHTLHR